MRKRTECRYDGLLEGCGVRMGAGTSTIDVSTVDSAANTIAGYYTTLSQNGVQVQSCFSPCSFTVSDAQSYQVAVADYGDEQFNHWTGGGSSDRFYTVAVPSVSTTISLTAVYSP